MTNKEKFLELAKYDNRLLSLEKVILEHVSEHKEDVQYCANSYWYGYDETSDFPGGFRGKLITIVGYGARASELRTSQAYDVCYEYLYSLLPDCRHEGMCRALDRGDKRYTLITISRKNGHTSLDYSKEARCCMTNKELNFLQTLADELEFRMMQKDHDENRRVRTL